MKNLILKVSIILMLTIASWSCQDSTIRNREDTIVDVLKIELITELPSQNYTGVIEESYTSMLSFQVAGNIQQIFITENQSVEKGQLLATLDREILQNSYDVALSTFKQTEDTYNRLKILHEENSLAEIKWIEIQTSFQSAHSMLNIAKRNLENCNLHSPFSGVITRRVADIGSNVIPGVPVFSLVDLKKVNVKIPVPENEISTIEIGQQVTIDAMALGSDNSYTAKIKEKAAIANSLSHTYDVKVELDNKDEKLLPGMICDVNIIIEHRAEPKVIVPNNSIMIDNDNSKFVWLVVNGIASKQKVTVGALSDLGVAICEGLNSEDKVIIGGNQKVSEGMKLKIR